MKRNKTSEEQKYKREENRSETKKKLSYIKPVLS
jgi:hypothetical protein